DVPAGFGEEHFQFRARRFVTVGRLPLTSRGDPPEPGLGRPHVTRDEVGLVDLGLQSRELPLQQPNGRGIREVGTAVVAEGRFDDDRPLGDVLVTEVAGPAPRADEPGERIDLGGEAFGELERHGYRRRYSRWTTST